MKTTPLILLITLSICGCANKNKPSDISSCLLVASSKSEIISSLHTGSSKAITDIHTTSFSRNFITPTHTECSVIAIYDHGGAESGILSAKNIKSAHPQFDFISGSPKTREIAETITPLKASSDNYIAVEDSHSKKNRICIGNATHPEQKSCDESLPDDYYTEYPETKEDFLRNEQYIQHHQLYVCRNVTPSYAEGVRVREYVVSDPRYCR